MKLKALIRKIFEKSSFHGFAYIVRRDIHWTERTLWGIILVLVNLFAISICWNQWVRYKENPIVTGIERILQTRQFPYAGITMCSDYFDDEQAMLVIQRTWNITSTDNKQFTYYKTFLETLSAVRYDNLKILKPYKNDITISNIDFLKILWDIHSYVMSTKNGKKDKWIGVIEYATGMEDDISSEFYSVITEIGMCFTTSSMHEYQNPQGFKHEPNDTSREVMCSPFDECSLKVTPHIDDSDSVTAYIHDNHDIVGQDNPNGIQRQISANEIADVDLSINVFEVEKQIRHLPIKYRKCRFTDENNLKYFKTYRQNLCRNECRIDAAFRLCKCKPFFYVVGNGPICNINGMLCLANANWTATKCDQCLGLCSHLTYVALKATGHVYTKARFERALSVHLTLPQVAIIRRVIFSSDQLIVAFGGSASLFLGCSFLSIAQLLYHCLEALEEKFKRLYDKFK